MLSYILSINVLKYLVPSCLAFMLGFYLAETVTSKVYSAQVDKLNAKHKTEIDTLQSRLTEIIENQNTVATRLNTTSDILADKNTKILVDTSLSSAKAIIKYMDRIVMVNAPCKISEPGLEYIRDTIIGE